jgi:hypothetical protein
MIKQRNLLLMLVFSLQLASTSANAQSDGICARASLSNPNAIEGGIGGTNIEVEDGTVGTGAAVAEGGIGGTNIAIEGGIVGTGAPVAQGGIGGTSDAQKTAIRGVGGTGAPAEHGGIGGTSDAQKAAIRGVGGTGAPTGRGGIGGTGDALTQNTLLPIEDQGGIAVVGVITGFASVCVGDVEVQYEPATPVFENGKKVQLAKLAVGKMVMLKAERVAGRLQARAIGMFDAVAGPVGRLDIARQQMHVMGQTVRLDKIAMQQLKGVAAGTNVQVSGHRLNNGEIVATRVDAEKTGSNVGTVGSVTAVNRDGFVVNGTSVALENKALLEKIKVGSDVRVDGSWNGKTIKADRVETQPVKNLVDRSDTAILEGFARLQSQGVVSIAGTVVKLTGTDPTQQANNFNGKVVKIEVRRGKNGDWVADRVEERQGKLFDRGSQLKDKSDNNSSSGGSNNDSNSSGDSGKSESSSSGGHGSSSGGSSSSSSTHESGSSVKDGSSSGGSSHGNRIESPKSSDRVRVESPRSASDSKHLNKIEKVDKPSGSHGK